MPDPGKISVDETATSMTPARSWHVRVSRPSMQALLRRTSSRAPQCVEGRVVGVGEGVEVLLGGAEAAVPEAFFDGLDVSAAGK